MIDNAYTLNAENMLRTLPVALQNDSRMIALAKSISQTLDKRVEEISRIVIYNRIDELPENLLDILARDFKVDWYDYDYSVAVKRRVLKRSFYVHRHLGTVGAVRAALDAIYPESKIEEWFDYDGEPYSFRVILNMSSAFVVPVDTERLLWAVNFYKSLRSHADGVYYQSAFHFGIGCKTGYVIYGERYCGTYPERATQGCIGEYGFIAITDCNGSVYANPDTGTLEAGTFPEHTTHGVLSKPEIAVATATEGVTYKPTRLSGEYPATATTGAAQASGISAEEIGLGVSYKTKVCGSAPGRII